MKIKVANIIEEGRLGGPQIRIAEVAGALRESNIETTVILPKASSEAFKTRLEKEGVKYKALSLHRLTKEPRHLLLFAVLFFYELFILYRYLKREKFDVVHNSGGSWQWKGIIAGKAAGCKVLWHLNDTMMPGYIKRIFKPLAKWGTDGYTLSAEKVRQYYLHGLDAAQKPVALIRPPVDCARFDPKSSGQGAAFAASGINIATVANINPVKGLETFIEVAAEVQKEYPQAEFYIVGPVYNSQSNYYKNLQELVRAKKLEGSVHFYGPSRHPEELLKSVDIYLCTSLSETGPMSLFEAMAMEKAIVSTDVGDVPSLINQGGNGFTVEVGDHKAMSERVIRFIKDRALRESCGKRARETALKHLDVRHAATQHEQIYTKVLRQGTLMQQSGV